MIGQPRNAVFPLNSRRLKLYQLQQLAQALKLPTNDDLRVMVKEKLRAMDRNLLSTQVVVDLQEEGTVSLQDEEGQFLLTFPILYPGRSSEPTPQVSPTHVFEFPESSQEEVREERLQDPHTVGSELVQEQPVLCANCL